MAGLSTAGVIQVPALGRPFKNGMMYDCRTNTLIPWITLWDPDVLHENTTTRTQESCDFHVITEDKLSKKSSALDMKADLSLSFLSGLIPVSGSAQYLNNHKTSRHQERVTLVYKYTTRFEELTMTHLQEGNMRYNAIYKHGTATHVVVGIVYGGHAFFLFDQLTAGNENKREIRGNLKALADQITGHASSVTEESEETKRVKCQFYGDMFLPKNPATYSEAVQVCQNLPGLVQANANKAVPMMVWLYPLHLLDPTAARVEHSISPAIVDQVESCLEELMEIEISCSDLREEDVCDYFTAVREDIRLFEKKIAQYVLAFKRNIGQIIQNTNVREVAEIATNEYKLKELLDARDGSPFRHQCLVEWVREREAQVQVLNNFMHDMGRAVRCIPKSQLYVEFLKPSFKVVACFEINLSGDCQQVQQMTDYLIGRQVGPAVNSTPTVASVAQSMAHNAHYFRDFALANVETPHLSIVIVENRESGSEQGGFIRIYKKGVLMNQNCECLLQTPTPRVDSASHDSFVIVWDILHDSNTYTKCYELSYQLADVDGDDWVVVQVDKTTGTCVPNDLVVVQVDKTTGTCVLSDLHPGMLYLVKLRVVYFDWYGAYSEVVKVRTRYTSPPGTPTIRQTSRTKVLVKWEIPEVIATDQMIDSYTIWCQDNTDGMWNEAVIVPAERGGRRKRKREGRRGTLQHEVQVDSGKQYIFKIEAYCGGSTSLASEESSSLVINTVNVDWLKKKGFGTCTPIGGAPACPVYKVKLNEVKRVGVGATHSYCFGFPKTGLDGREKTIVLIGGKEVQKGKLLNGMLNYILGVEYSDAHRFVILGNDEDDSDIGGESQTHLIVYKIYEQNGFVLPFTLNIVYTPDFGDNLESESVQEVTHQMEGHLSAVSAEGGIGQVDLICFIRHAADTQPTPMQICVFNSILAMLGSAAAKNIVTLFTFADECEQVSMGGADSMGQDVWYMFDTEAILAGCTHDASADEDLNKLKWGLVMTNFKKFFDYLSDIEPMDLQQTKAFLSIRDQFERRLRQMYDLVHRFHQLQVEYKVLQDHKLQIRNNKSIKYSFTECVSVKADFLVNQYTTTSRAVASTRQDRGGTIACVKDQMTIKKSTAELKQRYEDVMGKTMSVDELIQAVRREMDALGAVLGDVINEICQIQSELEGIALVPYPWSAFRYMDVLIETEQADEFEGWRERIEILQQLKERISKNFQPVDRTNSWCTIM